MSQLTVTRMGGSLIAESAGRGEGATFTLRLPIEPLARSVLSA
jgi:signal transduction histidine kinase